MEGKPLPQLSEPDIRVLGALMEKAKVTPDYYPMTLNGLTAACNQKTSRKPVVDYSEETVQASLNKLKGLSLVSVAVGGTSRSTKYKHNFHTVYPMPDAGLAVLCLLFLRGPQTPGEINTNSGRLYAFTSLESVLDTLKMLSTSDPPFVKELPRRPGQKETRFIHLLGDYTEELSPESSPPAHAENPEIESRIAALEAEVAALRDMVSDLRDRFTN